MAKSKRETKAQREARALRERKIMAEYVLNGCKEEDAKRHGIIQFKEENEITASDKADARAELKAVSDEVTALKEKAIALFKKDESNARELGGILIKIKAALEHGEFTKWWTKAELEQNRVSYCMRLAAPEGNKVQAAKERVKTTPRAKALRIVLKKLAKLYDVAEEGDAEKAKELFREIRADIEARFLVALEKAKAKAAAA